MKNTVFIIIITLAFNSACKKNQTGVINNAGNLTADSLYGLMVADTIIYDVVIKNSNPDDLWADECLKGLDKKLFIDKVFALIYSGQVKAFNHETNEKLTIKQVKEMENEPGYNREMIRMIQFNEAWFIDSVNVKIMKDINSMVLGSAVYTDNGEFVGNKALLRVEL